MRSPFRSIAPQQSPEALQDGIDDSLVGEQTEFGEKRAVTFVVGVDAGPKARFDRVAVELEGVLDPLEFQAGEVPAALGRF